MKRLLRNCCQQRFIATPVLTKVVAFSAIVAPRGSADHGTERQFMLSCEARSCGDTAGLWVWSCGFWISSGSGLQNKAGASGLGFAFVFGSVNLQAKVNHLTDCAHATTTERTVSKPINPTLYQPDCQAWSRLRRRVVHAVTH